MTKEDILQCLVDSGCGKESSGKIMRLLEENNAQGAMRLLKVQRRELLDNLHEQQKYIDCLDFLTYQMNKEKKMK